MIKRAAAESNADLKLLPRPMARAISRAALSVQQGAHDDQFVVDIFQTGSGTSTNMNANEVIARLAGRAHPNDHVNLGQSSNDVIPSAAHLAVLFVWTRELDPTLDRLSASLRRKSREFAKIVKLGRTHLMDAVPIRLGQEFGGYARQIDKSRRFLAVAADGLRELAIGGTAVGTGINTHPRFASRVCAALSRWTRIRVREAKDHFEAQGAHDDLVRYSGALRSLSVALTKIANDIRWMASGPMGGLAEIKLPALQPGSSIMPGKVNPVMCEVVLQVAAQVMGNDVAAAWAGASGHFELNAMIPVIAHNVLQSSSILAQACRQFADRCIDGIVADADRCEQLAKMSHALVTALVGHIGYDRAASIVKEAVASRRSVVEVALELRVITPRQARTLFDLNRLSR